MFASTGFSTYTSRDNVRWSDIYANLHPASILRPQTYTFLRFNRVDVAGRFYSAWYASLETFWLILTVLLQLWIQFDYQWRRITLTRMQRSRVINSMHRNAPRNLSCSHVGPVITCQLMCASAGFSTYTSRDNVGWSDKCANLYPASIKRPQTYTFLRFNRVDVAGRFY